MRGKYRNAFHRLGDGEGEDGVWSIVTEPKFGIGQRCMLLQTDYGNVLWDCITYLDDETVNFIKSQGGIDAMVISHPHYYSTHLDWARTFNCLVYIAKNDEAWLSRADPEGLRKLFEGASQQVVNGVTAVKVGGHFPGSLVLVWDGKMMIADSFVTTPSALYHVDRLPGTTSYAFMWAAPNMIPLPPAELHRMWRAIRPYEFTSTHGAFVGQEVRDERVKARVLESMKIQVKAMGWEEHALLKEVCP
ncbi:hypothetical protein LTR53_005748 [Teratosphaeriaceae sp. CCFEE 6253]|nr:hypothetical protein LTR53_005748 [Teratosphaeriaceae sp. CCFEE 6253]